jgi:hypothetical protein
MGAPAPAGSDNGHYVNEAAKAAALDHTIPLPSSFPVRGDHPCLLHPLERIAQGALWLERGADLLCAEACRMPPAGTNGVAILQTGLGLGWADYCTQGRARQQTEPPDDAA